MFLYHFSDKICENIFYIHNKNYNYSLFIIDKKFLYILELKILFNYI